VWNKSEVVENAIFSAFDRYIFVTFTDKAKIILSHVVPPWLSAEPKINDVEWPWVDILR